MRTWILEITCIGKTIRSNGTEIRKVEMPIINLIGVRRMMEKWIKSSKPHKYNLERVLPRSRRIILLEESHKSLLRTPEQIQTQFGCLRFLVV